MEDKNKTFKEQNIVIQNREKAVITGVEDIHNYTTLIKEELPDILVEDDCKSIGGETNMCSYNLPDNIKNEIKIIKVKEFGGIDNVKLY